MGKNKNIKQKRLSRHKTVGSPKIKLQARERKSGVASMPIIPGTWQTNAITFLLLVIATLVLYVGDLRLVFFAVDAGLPALSPGRIGGKAMVCRIGAVIPVCCSR